MFVHITICTNDGAGKGFLDCLVYLCFEICLVYSPPSKKRSCLRHNGNLGVCVKHITKHRHEVWISSVSWYVMWETILITDGSCRKLLFICWKRSGTGGKQLSFFFFEGMSWASYLLRLR